MDYDSLLPEIGAFGPYQKILICVVLFPTVFPCAFQAYSQLFIAATPNHWCQVPELSTWSANYTDLVRELSIPKGRGSIGFQYDQCKIYRRNYTEISSRFLEFIGNKSSTVGLSLETESCQHGWLYDTSLYPKTVVTEVGTFYVNFDETDVPLSFQFDLVCQKDFYSTFSLVIFGASGLIGNYVFGYLQDQWGRKPSYFTYLFIQITGGFLSAFSWNFPSWLFFRTIVGLTIPAILTSPYVIAIELVDPTKRSLCTLILNIAYSIGLVLLAVFVYLFRHWRHLSLAVSVPFLLLFLCYKFIPESPRWLIAVHKYERAQKVLQKIAKVNGKTLDKDFGDIFRCIRKKSDQSQRGFGKKYGIRDLFRTPKLRTKTIIITFIWFANTSVYVGLSYYAPALGGDEILNFFLSGVVELPTYIFLWPSLHYFGRRWILCLSMVIGGLACLSTFHFQGGESCSISPDINK